MLLAEFGTGQVFWSIVWFSLFFLWIWLVVMIFTDIFRSPDLSGWGKAAWSIFVIVFPYLGIFTYLIARGRKMSEHAADEAHHRDQMFRSYVHDVVASEPNDVDQLARLAALRDEGVIDEDEFRRMKARVTAA